jgi:hypothetical protein
MTSKLRYINVTLKTALVASCILYFMGCATSADNLHEIIAVPRVEDFQPKWEPIFKGVDLAEALKIAPNPQAVYFLRIDLKAPKVSFVTTPSNGERPLETDGKKTSDFLRETHCKAAINASPFSPVEEGDGKPKDIIGLGASNGELYSQPHGNHCALNISKENKPSFLIPPFKTDGAYNAVSGFGMLVEQGRNVGENDQRHPRTAVGASKDGRYLYMLVIDGRQPSHSIGATTKETADWLLQIGAFNAINLDGGGSSTLVIADEQGNPQVMNRPIHAKIPGMERVNGNNLGVSAPPLK